MAHKLLKLRRPGICIACVTPLDAGTQALWDPEARTVTCRECSDPGPDPLRDPALDTGVAGASAGREHQRRKQNREDRTRAKHPRIGGLLLALRLDPQHERAFQHGQLGEQAVAASLEKRMADWPSIALHDRRMPGAGGNIDHLAVAPTGVYVIDAKAWKGKVTAPKPLFGDQKLFIAARDRTSLIDGLDRQVAAVREALDDEHSGLPIRGVLCFTQAELPVFGTLTVRSHLLVYCKALAKRINQAGPVSPTRIEQIARQLAERLPPA